jgi:flagellar protein FlaG
MMSSTPIQAATIASIRPEPPDNRPAQRAAVAPRPVEEPRPAPSGTAPSASAPTAQDLAEQRARAERVAAELARAVPASASLRFRVDPDAGRIVVSVVDAATGDLLRQIPSEDALAMAKSLAATGSGIVSDRA